RVDNAGLPAHFLCAGAHDAARAGGVVEPRCAAVAGDVPAGQGAESIGVNLHQSGQAVVEAHHQLEIVVHTGEFNGKQMGVNLGHGAVDQIHQLINQMYAPVKQHAAARFAYTAPVAGNPLAA